jgi:hydroxymethylglutaryl-CoA lyase
MDYKTGVDLDALLSIAADLAGIVGHDVPDQMLKAGASTRRYPLPGRSDGPPREASSLGISRACLPG